MLSGALREKPVYQQGNIVRSITQRREANGHNIEPVVKVFPKVSLLDRFFKITIGGGDDPGIDFEQLRPAQAPELLRLQHAQKINLRFEGQLTHFIQQQRATVGKFKPPHLGRHGAGKRALFIAEQLALEEIIRQGPTIHRDKRTTGSRALMVDRPCDEFLASPAFSREQHRDIAIRYHFHQAVDPLHRLALADHLIKARPRFETISELLVLDRERMPLQRLIYHDGKSLAIDGLYGIVVGSTSHRLDCRIDGPVGGHDDDFRIRPCSLQAPQKLHPADTRHPKIGDDQFGRSRFQLLQPLLCRSHSAHLIPLLLEHRDQRPTDIDLVIDNENVCTWLHEVTAKDCDAPTVTWNVTTTVVPIPAVLDT